MDITKFVNKRSKEENQMIRFEKMILPSTTKQEQRVLEMHLLKPMPIPKYKGTKTGMSNFKKRTLFFSFPSPDFIKRLGKIVTINSYIENNCHEVLFLTELIRLIEEGRIKWDGKKYSFRTRRGGKIRL